ncbi:MAG: NUDIX hydrolase [Candidatus Thermoplasmatota archaeon]|nr:NUDIX hydrolase [Candidatus Thermoplasmatota archaeon]
MKSPKLTVDGVVIKDKKILLIKRKNDPFKGRWALPGGFVEYGETVEEAVVREVKEETGLETTVQSLLGVYSDPDRDPRGHTVSIAYLLSVKKGLPKGGDDASDTKFFDLNALPPLAFDHAQIVRDAVHKTS